MDRTATGSLSSNKTDASMCKKKLPKPIIDFVEALAEFCRTDLQEFWQQLTMDTIRSHIKEMDGP